MAIPFLNNITLNNNEIQNVRLHNTGTSNAAAGQIFFNTGVNLAQYYANGVDTWVTLKEYSFANGTYINSVVTGTAAKPIITPDLSATAVTGNIDATKYLRGDNKWAAVTSIYGWTLEGDTGGPTDIVNTTAVDIAGGTNVTTALVGSTLTINATDTNDNDYLTALSFNTGDGVLTATVQNQANVTVDLDGRYLTGNQAITLSGDVTGSGTTSIATTIAAGAVDFAMLNPTDVITAAEGIENNNNDITIPTSAAVKAYADSVIVGGLVYQGGYDAATNTPVLDNRGTQIAVNKGWTYTVTVAGTFYGEVVEVGDVLIAEDDLASGAGALTDWTTVQNNIDLANAVTPGIGNVVPGSSNTITAPYTSGTATLDVVDSTASQKGAVIVSGGTGISVAYVSGIATVTNTETNSANTYAETIADTDLTIDHDLNTRDIIVQLYDTFTYETVYADIDRITVDRLGVTFAATPTNSIRVLVQKIG